VRCGDAAQIEIAFHALDSGRLLECALLIDAIAGVRVAVVDIRESGRLPFAYVAGKFTVRVRIDALPLVDGDFTLGLWLVTESFRGAELPHFRVVARKNHTDFVPYEKNRGWVVLGIDSAISNEVSEWSAPMRHDAAAPASPQIMESATAGRGVVYGLEASLINSVFAKPISRDVTNFRQYVP
jgi:hypothetical protein